MKCRTASPGLREIERIPVRSPDGSAPAQPHSVALSKEGDIFVSLNARHCILCLDPAGRYLYHIGRPGSEPGELQGPTGVALDQAQRLWVAEWLNNRIQVFDAEKGILVIDPAATPLGPMRNPAGLALHPGGSMVVSDWSNRRVLEVSMDGACSVYSIRNGIDLEGDWRPVSFCSQDRRWFWAADRGRHRILKLDTNGTLLQKIGSCGIGVGGLFSPHSVAVFGDGVIAVGQDQVNQCLKLFSPEGEEICRLPVDFKPVAMAVQKSRLMVSAYDDDSLRVYERD